MARMSRKEKIAGIRAQISQTEERLEMLKRQLQQLEAQTGFDENEQLRNFEDFPRSAELFMAIEENACRIIGRSFRCSEGPTVEHLMMMSPEAISKHSGVGPKRMKRLTEWMEKHKITFSSENGNMLYYTLDKDEPLSTFNYLWDDLLGQETFRRLYTVIEEIAKSEGKHFKWDYFWLNYRKVDFPVFQKNAGDDYTVGDFLRVGIAKLQRKCGFSDFTMEKVVNRMREHGLEFASK